MVRVVALFAMVLLVGCGTDTNALFPTEKPDALQSVPPGALVSPEGLCEELPAGAKAPTKLEFGLTECDIVRIAGPIDKVEITEVNGVRNTALTSIAGAKPGVFRFVAGRLKSIEAEPEAIKPKPEPPKRRR